MAADPLQIPETFWRRADLHAALNARDMRELFTLLRRWAGASQYQISAAVDLPQPTVSKIMRGGHRITALDVYERIADGLGMPNGARQRLGLAPARSTVAIDLPEPEHHTLRRAHTPLYPEESDVQRRRLLQELAALGLTSALASKLETGELRRVVLVAAQPSRVDDATIGHIEAVLHHCRRQEDALGPRAALETVYGQQELVHSLLAGGVGGQRERLLSLLANVCRSIAWMLFNLNDFAGAEHYFAQARQAAHEADNDVMNSFVLANWSQLATWKGDARLGVEHALGALAWGQRAGSAVLVSYAHDVGARAYAAVVRRSAKGDRGKDHARCMRALDIAHAELTASADDDERSMLHFYDEALHRSTRTMCLLDLDDPAALPLARDVARDVNPRFVRNLAFARLDLARAYVQPGPDQSVELACEQVADAAHLSRQNTSPRLALAIAEAQRSLSPWNDTEAVRRLDQALHADSQLR